MSRAESYFLAWAALDRARREIITARAHMRATDNAIHTAGALRDALNSTEHAGEIAWILYGEAQRKQREARHA